MWPINYKVINLYNSVSSQVLMSMSGVYAINEIAVLNRIKLETQDIEEQKELLDLVVLVANKAISFRNEENRKQQEKKNGK